MVMDIANEVMINLTPRFSPFWLFNILITMTSILVFRVENRRDNDKCNKMRECIIIAILNGYIPKAYYWVASWSRLKKSIDGYTKQLECHDRAQNKNISLPRRTNVNCVLKAGRGHKYDFDINITYADILTTTHNIEFKFNAESVCDAPQFVSPMHPSKYLTSSFEEYYYDNYLPQLADSAQLLLPDRKTYLDSIHSTSPKCMQAYQTKYYHGCAQSSRFLNRQSDIAFYELAKRIDLECRQSFIARTDLNTDVLSEYLLASQTGKKYMLFSTKTRDLILQTINADDYILVKELTTKNIEKCRYECVSKSGKHIHVLLRWKNGNGIAYPAFQISEVRVPK